MLRESGPAGIELATCQLQVLRPTTKPPRVPANTVDLYNGHKIAAAAVIVYISCIMDTCWSVWPVGCWSVIW